MSISTVSNPQISNQLTKLKQNLTKIQYHGEFESEKILHGDSHYFIYLIRYAFTEYSPRFAKHLFNNNFRGLAYMEINEKLLQIIYNICLNLFNYHPSLSIYQFMSSTSPFTEQKMILLNQIIENVLLKDQELRKNYNPNINSNEIQSHLSSISSNTPSSTTQSTHIDQDQDQSILNNNQNITKPPSDPQILNDQTPQNNQNKKELIIPKKKKSVRIKAVSFGDNDDTGPTSPHSTEPEPSNMGYNMADSSSTSSSGDKSVPYCKSFCQRSCQTEDTYIKLIDLIQEKIEDNHNQNQKSNAEIMVILNKQNDQIQKIQNQYQKLSELVSQFQNPYLSITKIKEQPLITSPKMPRSHQHKSLSYPDPNPISIHQLQAKLKKAKNVLHLSRQFLNPPASNTL